MNNRRLPAEWEPQSGVLLTWPHKDSDWAPDLFEVDRVFAELTAAIAAKENVIVVHQDTHHRKHIESLLSRHDIAAHHVRFYTIPSNDSWSRDHGPIGIAYQETVRILNFAFDGWGEKYPASLDNQITEVLHKNGAFGRHEMESIDWVLEGGSIDTDGEGTLMTTHQCLHQRHPTMTRIEIEQMLANTLGAKRFLWLEHGMLAGDDTSGHIDTLARFCDPQTIAYVRCTDTGDEHFDALKDMETQLMGFRTAEDLPYHLVPLPMPKAIYAAGQRLPATYANFLIINGALLMPTYDDPYTDELAAEQLRNCFPDRSVQTIDCLPLIRQFGSLHCVSMQIPKGMLAET